MLTVSPVRDLCVAGAAGPVVDHAPAVEHPPAQAKAARKPSWATGRFLWWPDETYWLGAATRNPGPRPRVGRGRVRFIWSLCAARPGHPPKSYSAPLRLRRVLNAPLYFQSHCPPTRPASHPLPATLALAIHLPRR